MRRLIALAAAAALICGCTAANPSPKTNTVDSTFAGTIRYTHDAANNVGCWWAVYSTSISVSCLPDKAYR